MSQSNSVCQSPDCRADRRFLIQMLTTVGIGMLFCGAFTWWQNDQAALYKQHYQDLRQSVQLSPQLNQIFDTEDDLAKIVGTHPLRGWTVTTIEEYPTPGGTGGREWSKNQRVAEQQKQLTDAANGALLTLSMLINGYAARLGATTDQNRIGTYGDHTLVLHLSAEIAPRALDNDRVLVSEVGLQPVTLWVRASVDQEKLLPNQLGESCLLPADVATKAWDLASGCCRYVVAVDDYQLVEQARRHQPAQSK